MVVSLLAWIVGEVPAWGRVVVMVLLLAGGLPGY